MGVWLATMLKRPTTGLAAYRCLTERITVMLKQTSSLLGSFALLVCVAAPSVAAQDQRDIRRLETQIVELKGEISKLRASNTEIKKLLEAVAVAVLQDGATEVMNTSELENCKSRLHDLQSKKDQLRTLGFSDKYPDIVNITKQMNDIQKECDALEASKQQ